MKRLEQDRFVWPRRSQAVLELSSEQLHWLLEGIDLEAVRRHPVRQYQHIGLKFVTPAQRHDGQADAILRHREQVYEAAKRRCPERWSGATRNWKLKDEVWLNPERAEPGSMQLAA